METGMITLAILSQGVTHLAPWKCPQQARNYQGGFPNFVQLQANKHSRTAAGSRISPSKVKGC